MLKGSDFIKKMQGIPLDIDYNLLAEYVAELESDYPEADIVIGEYDVQARYKTRDDKVLCLRCGNPLNQRANYEKKHNEWVPLKKKDNVSNYECETCYPDGNAPIVVSMTAIRHE